MKRLDEAIKWLKIRAGALITTSQYPGSKEYEETDQIENAIFILKNWHEHEGLTRAVGKFIEKAGDRPVFSSDGKSLQIEYFSILASLKKIQDKEGN